MIKICIPKKGDSPQRAQRGIAATKIHRPPSPLSFPPKGGEGRVRGRFSNLLNKNSRLCTLVVQRKIKIEKGNKLLFSALLCALVK